MSSLFATLSIASGAMSVQQKNLQIIEQNVTNVNTDGYHRQEAVFKNGLPYGDLRFKGTSGGGQMGTGVLIDEIKRYTLEFFDDRYRKELSDASRWETEGDILSEVETTLNETDESSGLTVLMDDFWAGWQALNSDPSNMALRADLVDRAQALTDGFNTRAEALVRIREDLDLSITERVEEINSIATQLAALNAEIPRVQSLSNQPNDLLDERDRLLDRLAEISGMTATTQENGETIVSIGGHVLVVGTKTNELTTYADSTNSNLENIQWADGQPFTATTGELAGLFDARDNVIVDQQEGLDELAQTLCDQVNYVHEHGYSITDPNGIATPPPPPLPADATAYQFFTIETGPGSVASRLTLDSNITDETYGLSNIAAAEGPDYAPGDGNNALEISNLRDSLLMNSNSTSMNDYYAGQIADLGLAVSRAETKTEDATAIMDSLKAQREEVAGVSLDEEAVKMTETQAAYNAAARMVTAIDEMIDRVINNMGLVGL